MSKRKSIIFLSIVLVLIVLISFLGINGLAIGRYDILPLTNSVQLGLDLRGGVYALYEAQNTDIDNFNDKMSAAMDILRKRLDGQGYTEATIAREGDARIRVEIPEVDDPNAVLDIIGKPALLQFIGPDGAVIMEGKDISYARATTLDGSGNQPIVQFELKDEGAKAFAKATAKFIGQIISIQLDGKEISSPEVQGVIPSGNGYIEGMESIDAAKELAMLIESGALPIELEQLQAKTISATLGVDALRTSLLAGLIGIIALFIFLIVFYRLTGFLTDIALMIYIIIVIYVIAIFGVQLTLPGIAGIILGIGMAVDANVIIFERIKEELRTGKSFRASIDSGFKKAFVTILDANITTLIAAFVLMYFGTGQIKGFAYTLAIGIIASMFTALVVTRQLLRGFLALNIKNPKLYLTSYKSGDEKVSKIRSIKVMKNSKIFGSISSVIIAVGLVVLLIGGFNLGIDFTGGTIFTVDIGKTFEVNDVIKIVDEQTDDDIRVSISEDTKAIIRIQDKDADADTQNALRQNIANEISKKYSNATIESQDRVGAVAGSELTRNAFMSVLVACIFMLSYIWIRFELLSGLSALVALLHDVAIMIAVVLILRVQINSAFIAAILTIVGYSINDTIVVFDRIRENTKSLGRSMKRRDLVDKSISETIVRSLNTSITTLFTITALYILGVQSIKEFALPLIVGVLSGTYSSIFIASPFWTWIHDLIDKRKSNKSKKSRKKA